MAEREKRLPDLDWLRRQVAEKVGENRYRHSIAVQKEAMRLAARWNADWYRAGVAGLVHDICKGMAREAQLNYLRSCGILLDILTLECPPVWHALAGGVYARDVLGIEDEDILNAIRFHTTGRREMSPLEKVVFVADLTAEGRSYPDLPEMRDLADRDLDAAVFHGVRHAMRKQVEKGRAVTRDTWEAYNYYRPERDGES